VSCHFYALTCYVVLQHAADPQSFVWPHMALCIYKSHAVLMRRGSSDSHALSVTCCLSGVFLAIYASV